VTLQEAARCLQAARTARDANDKVGCGDQTTDGLQLSRSYNSSGNNKRRTRTKQIEPRLSKPVRFSSRGRFAVGTSVITGFD
jgi:hypothetical protein